MNPLWILVCNSTRGRIFEIGDEPSAWQLIDSVIDPETRENFDDFAPRDLSEQTALELTRKGIQRARFVSTLVAKLDQASRMQRFYEWMIVAPPHFLSTVKEQLTDRLREQLAATVDLDFNHLDARNLCERLRYLLPAPAHPDAAAM